MRSEKVAPQDFHPLGLRAYRAGAYDRAVELLERAVGHYPAQPELWADLGGVYGALNRLADAERCCRRALQLEPGNLKAQSNLGAVLLRVGRLREAEQCYRRVLALMPGSAFPRPEFARAHSNLIFVLDLMAGVDMAQQQAERRDWYRRHGQAPAAGIKPHENSPEPERKLKIGYVSADFCRHSACDVFAPVICGHDPSACEVVCYSGVKVEDERTARLRAAAHAWRSTLGVPDEQLDEQIRRDGIDILVDLSGHSAGSRLALFLRKPAPVQVTAWGYANGTGVQTIDYLFSDSTVVAPAERELFAEELVDLPCVLCYEPPPYAPEVSPLPCLQGKPFTFGCINRIEKITDATIAVWGRILQAAPEARLLLKHKGLDDPGLRQQILHRLAQVGGIRAAQVMLAGNSEHAEHLKIFQQVDCALDPFPHGGGVSSAEALYLGVGVVTLRGATIPSRVTASMLTGLELQDWIAQSEDDYVRIALEAVRHPSRLASLRKDLRQRVRQSSFGELHRYTRAVERAYRTMWRRWCVVKK